jgi:plasmid replication initiation protein
MPHLLHLAKEFTKYPLIEALKFRSQYTWRLFEMLMSVKAQKKPVLSLSVDDFREKMGIPKGYVWSDVNNTINKAISEIETKTEFEISLKKTKKADNLHGWISRYNKENKGNYCRIPLKT